MRSPDLREFAPIFIVALLTIPSLTTQAAAQATIDSISVLQPSCGVPPDGMIQATVTLNDCSTEIVSEVLPGPSSSVNLCLAYGLGTHAVDLDFDAEVAAPSTPIVATLVLRHGFGGPVIETASTGFDCTTGAQSSCAATPLAGCRTAALSKVKSKQPDNTNRKDSFKWTWKKGEATTLADLGDPTSTTSYSVCLYEDGQLRGEHSFPADPSLWKAVNTGFIWKDSAASLGKSSVKLKTGIDGKASISVSSSRVMALDPGYPFQSPVTVQLVNGESGLCFESVFAADDLKKNKTFEANDPLFADVGVLVGVDK